MDAIPDRLFSRLTPLDVSLCHTPDVQTSPRKPDDDYRSGRARGDTPGVESQQQEAGATGIVRARGEPNRTERTLDLRGPAAAREARHHRGRLRRRHSARKTAETGKAVRPVRAAGTPDRFRGNGRPAGRPDLPAARPRRGRRRSPESAGAD